MLSKITMLLCFCLTIAASKSAQESKNGLKALHQNARVSLSSLSFHCTTDLDTLILTAQTTALYQSTNCSASAITKAVEQIYMYSAEYVSKAMEIVTEIGLHFTGCSVELIPLNVITCVIKGLMELPAEIETLIDVSLQYFGNILGVVTSVLSDVANCFTNSTQNYQLVLGDLVLKAEVCEATLKA